MKNLSINIIANSLLLTLFLTIFITHLSAQTITINTTYSENTEIYPFGTAGQAYGLKINGNIELDSDTSLVRIILLDSLFNEYLVYEAYPYICTSSLLSLENVCDETCFSNGFVPSSLEIQIVSGELELVSIVLDTTTTTDAITQQQNIKMDVELDKVDNIKENILNYQMIWFADTNSISNLSYQSKKVLFGENYNLGGLDYYLGGVYDPTPNTENEDDDSPLVPNFDWRNRHGANDTTKGDYYFANNEEGKQGWLTSIKWQGEEPSCKNLCYIYGPLAAVEGVANIYFNQHLDFYLSVQNILECRYFNSNPCAGGDPDSTLAELKQNGVVNNTYYERRNYPQYDCMEELDTNDYLYTLKITDFEDPVTYPVLNRVDTLKKTLIEEGPVKVTVSGYSSTQYHVMALVGYGTLAVGDTFFLHDVYDSVQTVVVQEGSPYIGDLYWIYKNSWDINWGANGYSYQLDKHPYPGDPQAIVLPIIVDHVSDSIEKLYFDKDNDGYYNWGIGERPSSCPNTELDSDDSEPRIGPFDENYFGKRVAPDMKVTSQIEPGTTLTIEDDDFVTFTDTSNREITFKITNYGNAQLNLFSFNPVTSSDTSVFKIIDQPSSKISKDGEFSTFTVEYTIKDGPGYDNAIITIQTQEPEYGNFEFVLSNFICPDSLESNIIISDTANWDHCGILTGNIYVQRNAVLTISGKYGFVEESNIFVSPGGRLIIDGGMLSNACGSSWNGIDVWGVSKFSQFVTKNQGYLKLQNSACINNAIIAIEAAKIVNGQYKTDSTGGIILCSDAKFLNNSRDIIIYPFNNTHPTSGEKVLNLCYFHNTEFINTVCSPNAKVSLWGVEGISFKGCSFTNDYYSFVSCDKGIGINSFSSGFYVDDYCLDDIYPCNSFQQSIFENLEYGIYAYNGELSKYISIDTAIFKNNLTGIYMSMVDNQSVIRNSFIFDETHDLTGDTTIGLYLETCTGYQVEENYFTNTTDNITTMGIQILTSGGAYNEIYNNTFSGFTTGISAAGGNRDISGKGLCLKCNDFDDCTTDIFVSNGDLPSGPTIGIAEKQGDFGYNASLGVDTNAMAAGNTFTVDPTGNNYEINDSCNSIYYYHQEDNVPYKIRPLPVTTNVIRVEDIYAKYSKDTSCSSNLNASIIDELLEKSIVTSEFLVISAYNDTLDLLTDGGDTDALNNEIQFSLPNEAIELRQQLLDESPYLSDTTMKSAIDKEDVLPNAMIRDVLVANPQSAKTPDVLQSIDNRIDPMSEYMKSEIMAGQHVVGAKELLEQKLAFHKSNRDKSLMKLEKHYMSDTLNPSLSNDSLMSLWGQEPYHVAKYKLSLFYINVGDSSNSFSTLNDIPNVFELNEKEESYHEDFEVLLDVLERIHCDSILLDNALVQSLLSIHSNRSKAGVYARNLLIQDSVVIYNEPIFLPDLYKSSPASEFTYPEIDKESQIAIFPNPAGNYFIIEFEISKFNNNSKIVISDLNGKLIKSFILEQGTNQQVIPTEGFVNGTYLVQLYQNNSLIEVEKIVIIK